MPRPSNTAARRHRIVEGLRQVMAERGYERASIQEIARAAGLTPGLVHYHFASKQEVLLELAASLAHQVRERWAARRASAPAEPRARLRAFIDAHLALGPDADPAAVACWVAIGVEAIHQPEVRAAYRRIVEDHLDEIEPLIADALRAKRPSARAAGDPGAAPTPRALAAALLAAIQGVYQLAVSCPGAAPEGFAAPAVWRMARGLLATTSAMEDR